MGEVLLLFRFGLIAGGWSAFGDAGRLAAAIAQIIELGPAHRAAALDLDGFDHRREHREHTLDAFAEADLAHGEALLQPVTGAGDAHALIGLDALALAFLDADVDPHGVAWLEGRDLLAGGDARRFGPFQFLDHVHVALVLLSTRLDLALWLLI